MPVCRETNSFEQSNEKQPFNALAEDVRALRSNIIWSTVSGPEPFGLDRLPQNVIVAPQGETAVISDQTTSSTKQYELYEGNDGLFLGRKEVTVLDSGDREDARDQYVSIEMSSYDLNDASSRTRYSMTVTGLLDVQTGSFVRYNDTQVVREVVEPSEFIRLRDELCAVTGGQYGIPTAQPV